MLTKLSPQTKRKIRLVKRLAKQPGYPRLTKRARLEYIGGGGRACPYCTSPILTTDGEPQWNNTLTIAVRCSDCDARWTDVYRLSDMIPEPLPTGETPC